MVRKLMVMPSVPIDVDEETGVWYSDGLPMLYVPRHFFNNLHLSVEDMIGRDTYKENLYASGYKSAWFWCDKTAEEYGLDPMECYRFYLQRLSQRGWGLFQFGEESLSCGFATIEVSNSSFVLHKKSIDLESKHNSCYMFAGWFAGAADWVSDKSGWGIEYKSYESQCASCFSGETCLFRVEQQS